MAAALAASLPAPSSATTVSKPTYEAIPASMSKVIDIEAEIPLTCVQLDGMVAAKILKHVRETPSSPAQGLLLGLDLDGLLEVSNSFPIPQYAGDEEDKSSRSVARYQTSMLRSLKEVQADDSVVGFYLATTSGTYFHQMLVDTQAIHHEKLRHGGVVIVHDASRTARCNASFRAFRLTSKFLSAYKKTKFNTASLMNHSLTFSTILEEIPLQIRTNPLLGAFLEKVMKAPVSSSGFGNERRFARVDVGRDGLTRNLEQIVETIDSYRTEEGNVAFLTRQIARERARAESYSTKRKEENAARVAQGLVPLPEEDVSRLFKIPAEPSRLESMLLLGQIDAHGKSLACASGVGMVKMYAARAS